MNKMSQLFVAASVFAAVNIVTAAPLVTVKYKQLKNNRGTTLNGMCSGFLHPYSYNGAEPPTSLNSSLLNPLGITKMRGRSGSTDEYVNRNSSSVVYVGTFSGSWQRTPPWESGKWAQWQDFVRDQVLEQKAKGNHPIYAVWNEPPRSGAGWTGFKKAYRIAANVIRDNDPQAKIAGPNITFGRTGTLSAMKGTMNNFRTFCIDRGVVPDYYTFHFGTDKADDLARHIRSYSGENDVFMSESIKENWVQQPSTTTWQIANLENNAPLDFAIRSLWSSRGQTLGTLGGTVFKSGSSYKKRGIWWVYKRYNAMKSMSRLTTSVSNSKLSSLAGKKGKVVRMLIGNKGFGSGSSGYTGVVNVKLTDIKSTRGDGKLYLKVERIPYNSHGEVSAPSVIKSGYFAPSGSNFKFNINYSNSRDAYFVYIGSVKGS